MRVGCSRCGHVWDSCECPDLEEVGENRDMFEKEVDTRTMFQFLDQPVEDCGESNPHYKQGNIQPIDLIKDMGDLKPFCLGNAIKYIVRSRHKGSEKRDIEKAIDYLKMVLEEL